MNFEETYGDTVSSVSAAAARGDADALKTLLDAGRSSHSQDNRGWKPMHHAAWHGHRDCLEMLLQQDTRDIDWRTFDGSTALTLSCSRLPATATVVHLLLEKGADVRLSDDMGKTGLHHAARRRHLEAVRWLVRSGADVDARCHWGQTPMHALMENRVSDGLTIVRRPEEVEEDDDESTAVAVAKYLVKRGADVRSVDELDLTPFSAAIVHARFVTAGVILDSVAGDDDRASYVNRMSGDYSPLAIACLKDGVDPGFVDLLLASGADPDLPNGPDRDLVALHLACQGRGPEHAALVRRLLPLTDPARLAPPISAGGRGGDPLARSNVVRPPHPLRSAIESNAATTEILLRVVEPDGDLLPLPCPSHVVCPSNGDDCYFGESLLAFHLSCPDRPFAEEHLRVLRVMIDGGWTLNPSDVTLIPPLTAFAIYQEAADRDVAARVFRLLSESGATKTPRDALLLLALAKKDMLVLGCREGLIDLEDLAAIAPDQVSELVRRRDGQVIRSVLTFLLVSSSVGLIGAQFSAMLDMLKSELGLKYPDAAAATDMWARWATVRRILDNVSQPYSLMTLARNGWRRHLRDRTDLKPSAVATFDGGVPKVLREFLYFSELDINAVGAVMEQDDFEDV